MKIGFALITSDPFFSSVIDIENELHKKYTLFNKLGHSHNLPHTTLFQGNMSDDLDYKELTNKIAEIVSADKNNKIVEFTDVRYIPNGWYFIECTKSEFLQNLHEYTLQKVEKHIILSPERTNRNFDDLTIQQIEGIKKYGYRYSMKAFYPHITIGRMKEKNLSLISDLENEFSKINRNTSFERVTTYVMGENGTHKDTLYEVKL